MIPTVRLSFGLAIKGSLSEDNSTLTLSGLIPSKRFGLGKVPALWYNRNTISGASP